VKVPPGAGGDDDDDGDGDDEELELASGPAGEFAHPRSTSHFDSAGNLSACGHGASDSACKRASSLLAA
jgi:hypothetical protein